MSRTTEAVTARVPGPIKRRVEELAEETGNSQSAMAKELIKDGLEAREEDTARRRSVSPITILGVVAIAVAPTLLATGYTGLGIGLGAFAAAYVLLWATAYDVVLERHLEAAREELDEAGGVVGFFRLMWFDHHVEDPDTIVERAARLDLYAPVAGVLAILAAGVAAVLQYFGYLGSVLDVVGPWGAIGWAVLIVALAYLFALMLGISALASLAVASARAADEPVVEEVAAGE